MSLTSCHREFMTRLKTECPHMLVIQSDWDWDMLQRHSETVEPHLAVIIVMKGGFYKVEVARWLKMSPCFSDLCFKTNWMPCVFTSHPPYPFYIRNVTKRWKCFFQVLHTVVSSAGKTHWNILSMLLWVHVLWFRQLLTKFLHKFVE